MLSHHRSASLPLAKNLHCNSQDLQEDTQASLVLALEATTISINSSRSSNNNTHKAFRYSNRLLQNSASKMPKFTTMRKPNPFQPTSSACSRNSRKRIDWMTPLSVEEQTNSNNNNNSSNNSSLDKEDKPEATLIIAVGLHQPLAVVTEWASWLGVLDSSEV